MYFNHGSSFQIPGFKKRSQANCHSNSCFFDPPRLKDIASLGKKMTQYVSNSICIEYPQILVLCYYCLKMLKISPTGFGKRAMLGRRHMHDALKGYERGMVMALQG